MLFRSGRLRFLFDHGQVGRGHFIGAQQREYLVHQRFLRAAHVHAVAGLAHEVAFARQRLGRHALVDQVAIDRRREARAHFRAQQWTDELPVIPPTRERVEAFLKYTTRKPFERIAVLPQANLEAVPWNIAVNAVMAGCSPECMPLLIAAVEALADNEYNLSNIGTTWGVLPFLLINVGTYFGILTGHPVYLHALGLLMTVYGAYVLYLMLRRPEDLATEENHVSWAHMYRMMFVLQVGFALAYLL